MDVLQASPEETAATVLQRMRRAHVSSIVITDLNSRPIGIVTERDVLRLIHNGSDNLQVLSAADLMTSPVYTLPGNTDYQTAYKAMQSRRLRHIVVVNSDGSLRGITSESDFVQHIGIEYLTEVRLVDAVMEPEIVCIDADAFLKSAFTAMAQYQVSCLIVGSVRSIEGIITERDAVRLLDDEVDLDHNQVASYMSKPVITVPEGTSLIVARQKMEQARIRRLIVTDKNGQATGILTRQNLIDRLQNHFLEVMRDAINSLTQKLHSSQHREQRYRGFFENSPLAYQSLDNSGCFLEVNGRWREIMGYSNEEIEGQPFKSLLVEPFAENFDPLFEQFKQSNVVNMLDCQLRTKDGTVIDVRFDGRVARDPDGTFIQTHCLMTNLTEQRRIDSQLQVFRTLIDSSNDALYVINVEDSQILDVNQAAIDMLGYNREELLSRKIPDISARFNTLQKWQAKVDSIRQCNSRQVFEGIQITRSGDLLPVEVSSRLLTLGNKELVVSTVRDISDRKEAEARSHEEKRFLQAVIDCIGDPVMVIDTNYEIITANKAAKDDYLQQPSAPCSANQHQLCHLAVHQSQMPCDGSDHRCPLKEIVTLNRSTTMIHEHTNRHGDKRTVELMASPLYNSDGQVSGIVESARDITDHIRIQKQLQEKEKSLDHLAHHDPLTQLPNRLLFTDRLNQALRNAKRNHSIVALLFLDLDEFKEINDSFGHGLGDRLLKQVSIRLKECVRANDTIARLGGDEFTVISSDLDRAEDAAVVAQHLISAIRRPFVIDEQRLHVTLSIGISLYPNDSDNADTLVRNADTAMYRAKASGKSRYDFYTKDMTDQAFERILMLGAMRNALEQEQFVLHFQPQFDLRSREIIGAEALIRWRDPQLGLIEPARFIPVAEKTGLIDNIDVWVLSRVCRYINDWKSRGIKVPKISLNISARHFGNNSLASEITEILQQHHCTSTMIELELTESVILNNPSHAGHELRQLREMGIQLAIDDFGTGYSSLSYLKKLPLNRLKIDRSFIMDIPDDHNDQAISRAVIALANSLGLEVIAEGMETEEQLQFLLAEGCNYAQGHYFSRALPEDEFLELLTENAVKA